MNQMNDMTARNITEVAKVYSTTDYSLFKRIRTNRDVTEARVKKLKASFGEKDILNPIIVNEKFEVIDGQGRFEARKSLGMPIVYLIAPGTDAKDCARLNLYNTKWSTHDWVASWMNNADEKIAENYRRLHECAVKNGIPYMRTLRLANKSDGPNIKIESGTLVFSEADAEAVERVIKAGEDILNALAFTARTTDSFWTAVKIMIDTKGYNHSKMLNNCVKNRGSYGQMSNLEAQLKEFSRIYNYKRNVDSKLYFEEYMRNKGHNVRDYDHSTPFLNGRKPDVSTLQTEFLM